MAFAVRFRQARAPSRAIISLALVFATYGCRPVILVPGGSDLEVGAGEASILLAETSSGPQLEPQFLVSDLDQLAEGGIVRLLRDADASCNGGRVVDYSDIDAGTDTLAVEARYTGFTAASHAYRALFVSESGTRLCSNEIVKSTSGEETGIVQLVGGSDGTYCIRLSDQTVKCWGGSGSYGRNGDGQSQSRATPVTVSGLSGATEIVHGGVSACAISGGNVSCWGYNGTGGLGDGTVTQRNSPVSTGISGATKLAAGFLHACALVAGGGVKCWGSNGQGQLGDGTLTQRNSPIDVLDGGPALSGATAISAGYNFTCALMTGGTVKCWGQNNVNQMVDGSGTNRSSPVTIAGLTGIVSLATHPTGANTACAIRNDGRLLCWGASLPAVQDMGVNVQRAWLDDAGKAYVVTSAGDFKFSTISATPSFASVGMDAPVWFAGGASFKCALLSDARVKCWGPEGNGSFGRGDRAADSQLKPVQVPVSGVVQIAGLYGITCVKLSDATAKCWGGSYYGSTPTVVPGLSGIDRINVGAGSACAILTDKTLRCWGANASGQLGDGTTVDKYTPINPGLANVEDVAIGLDHTCAVITGGTLQCWGNNDHGQMGDGTLTPSLVPKAALDTGVASLSAGYARTCATHVDGSVKCWGWSQSGSLGNGAGGNYPNPVQILSSAYGIVKTVSGTWRTIALSSTGTVYFWGRIGISSYFWTTPVSRWFGGATATDISTGAWHSCVALSNNTVECWGVKYSGARGEESLDTNPSDFVESDTSTVATHFSANEKLALGTFGSCALRPSGKVYCLGSNSSGQLGSEVGAINYSLPANASYVMKR